MKNKFIKHLKEIVDYKNCSFLLAISGGVDSMVLFNLFKEYSLNFSVAHCNFLLRGKSSDDDELFVKEICERFNHEVYLKKFDTKKIASKSSVSIQMAARKLRGLEMNPDWYKIPIFYFSNPNCCYGHKQEIPYPKQTDELDFELEFAIIIGNGGINIDSSDAEQYIAGYTILNDWSARDLQREEMPMSLGPAKGKDFASSFGPYMVTKDELSDAWDEQGNLNLRMTCHVNDKLISDGNTNDLYHSFGDMIERASLNTNLLPGDYIGSGTVGTGCILELRPENTDGWIEKGDTVTLTVEHLGSLENKIV